MSYQSLLLMFKGEYTSDFFHPENEAGSNLSQDSAPLDDTTIDDATLAYGLGIWRFVSGDLEGARQIFLDIVGGEAWPAFGHIAAEAELRDMMR